MPIYKVFPAIGVARVGNSEEYYLAPETTGGLPDNGNNNRSLAKVDFGVRS